MKQQVNQMIPKKFISPKKIIQTQGKIQYRPGLIEEKDVAEFTKVANFIIFGDLVNVIKMIIDIEGIGISYCGDN